MATIAERMSALARRLDSLSATARAQEAEMRQWESDYIKVCTLSERLASIHATAGDAELEPLLVEDLEALEADVRVFAEDTPLHRAFFAQRPAAPKMEPVTEGDPRAYRKQRVAWRLGRLDLEHPQRWRDQEQFDTFLHIVRRLSAYEGMTWEEVHIVSKHNHEWETVEEWEPPSRRRVEALELDDQTGWYQLQIDKLGRVYGFRQANVLTLVWWDRDHDVYKTKRR